MGASPLLWLHTALLQHLNVTGQKKTGKSTSGWRTVSVRVSAAALWPKSISEPAYNHPNCTLGIPIAPRPAQPTLPQRQVLAQALALPADPRGSCCGSVWYKGKCSYRHPGQGTGYSHHKHLSTAAAALELQSFFRTG